RPAFTASAGEVLLRVRQHRGSPRSLGSLGGPCRTPGPPLRCYLNAAPASPGAWSAPRCPAAERRPSPRRSHRSRTPCPRLPILISRAAERPPEGGRIGAYAARRIADLVGMKRLDL